MKLNQLEVTNKLDETTILLQEIFEGLVKLNMGNGQFDIDTSPQLAESINNLNKIVNKINKITDYRELH